MDSSGIDTDLEEFIISSVNLQCTCGTDKSSHHRSCPLNPRNKGKPAEKSDVEVITSDDAKPLVIGKTPSIGWMNSAALLMQDVDAMYVISKLWFTGTVETFLVHSITMYSILRE